MPLEAHRQPPLRVAVQPASLSRPAKLAGRPPLRQASPFTPSTFMGLGQEARVPEAAAAVAGGRGGNGARRWVEFRRRTFGSPAAATADAPSGASGGAASGSLSSSIRWRGPGHMAARIAQRLRSAKGAQGGSELETSLSVGPYPSAPIDEAAARGEETVSPLPAQGRAGEPAPAPRDPPSRRLFPSSLLLGRSSRLVQSGILEPRTDLWGDEQEGPQGGRGPGEQASNPGKGEPASLHAPGMDSSEPSHSSRAQRGGGEGEEQKGDKVPELDSRTRDESQQEAALHAVWALAVEKLRAETGRLERINRSTMSSGFDALYDSLRRRERATSLHSQSVACALMSCNRFKNRYSDVLPYDESRVVLAGPQRHARDGSDYINASHVSAQLPSEETEAGLVLPHYIAAQGPLDSTVGDFWEMAQQQKCVAVLMLSRTVEGNKVKCAPYFPEQAGASEMFQHMRVTTLSAEPMRESPSTVERQLLLEDTRPGGAQSRIAHYYYLDWPDHGVPQSTEAIRMLTRHLRESPQASGPFIVHCSAGIGRTGTYCCIDYTLRRLLAGDLSALDIPGTVVQLRHQRGGMVQTRDQFRFCYAALLDEMQDVVRKHVC